MFLPVKNTAPKSLLPRDCTFSQSDWTILSGFWHPVARSDEVAGKPVGAKLLDLNLVLYRTPGGVSAAKDVCMHRGGKLSLGSMRDGLLVCGFHGLHYDVKGVCVRVPALAKGSPISERLRLETFLCQERYGFVWVCIAKEPRLPLPEWTPIEKDAGTMVYIEPYYINASAGRRVENFNDIAHFPFVHTGTIGGPESDIAPYEVDITDKLLSFGVDVVEQVRYVSSESGEPVFRNAVYDYELTLPFASTVKVLNPTTGDVYRIYDIVSPISVNRSRVYQLVLDESRKMPPESLRDFTMHINDEDTPQVEGQSPHELPLDLRDEIHIPADRMSIEYRRAMARLGLGAETCA